VSSDGKTLLSKGPRGGMPEMGYAGSLLIHLGMFSGKWRRMPVHRSQYGILKDCTWLKDDE
jgi:hypothetical protein